MNITMTTIALIVFLMPGTPKSQFALSRAVILAPKNEIASAYTGIGIVGWCCAHSFIDIPVSDPVEGTVEKTPDTVRSRHVAFRWPVFRKNGSAQGAQKTCPFEVLSPLPPHMPFLQVLRLDQLPM